MQENKKDRKELIREAEKLIKELGKEEAKIASRPNDEALLEALFKSKNLTEQDS